MRRLALALGVAVASCGGGGPAPRPAPSAPAPPIFRDLLLQPADCKTPPRPTVTRAGAMADLAVLERVVTRGWAGYEVRRAGGVDFAGAFGALRRFVEGSPATISVEIFRDRVVEALRPANDGHLALFGFTAAGGHSARRSMTVRADTFTAALALDDEGTIVEGPHRGAKLVSCVGHATSELFRPSLSSRLARERRPIVVSATPPPPLRCVIGSPDARPIEIPMRKLRLREPPDAPREPAFERTQDVVPRLRLRTFWGAKHKELTSFVASAPDVRRSPASMIDLRGNEGGSDSYAVEWLAGLTQGPLVGYRMSRLDSEVTRQGIVNENTCALAEGIADDEARRDVEERLAYGNRVVAEAERGAKPVYAWIERQRSAEGKAPSPLAAPLVVLVDRGCASACESFVLHARQLPRAIVVGESTAGVGAFAEVLVYRLPATGLGVSAGMKRFAPPPIGADFEESRGFGPDLYLDADDPPAVATALAECLAKKTCALSDMVVSRPGR